MRDTIRHCKQGLNGNLILEVHLGTDLRDVLQTAIRLSRDQGVDVFFPFNRFFVRVQPDSTAGGILDELELRAMVDELDAYEARFRREESVAAPSNVIDFAAILQAKKERASHAAASTREAINAEIDAIRGLFEEARFSAFDPSVTERIRLTEQRERPQVGQLFNLGQGKRSYALNYGGAFPYLHLNVGSDAVYLYFNTVLNRRQYANLNVGDFFENLCVVLDRTGKIIFFEYSKSRVGVETLAQVVCHSNTLTYENEIETFLDEFNGANVLQGITDL